MQIPIRVGRAIASMLLLPGHEVQAVAVSESISAIFPLFEPKFMEKVIGAIIVILYKPNFTYFYVSNKFKNDPKYEQAEICTLLLFFLTYTLLMISET